MGRSGEQQGGPRKVSNFWQGWEEMDATTLNGLLPKAEPWEKLGKKDGKQGTVQT